MLKTKLGLFEGKEADSKYQVKSIALETTACGAFFDVVTATVRRRSKGNDRSVEGLNSGLTWWLNKGELSLGVCTDLIRK